MNQTQGIFSNEIPFNSTKFSPKNSSVGKFKANEKLPENVLRYEKYKTNQITQRTLETKKKNEHFSFFLRFIHSA